MEIKKYTGVKDHHLNLDYVQVPLMLKAYVAPQFAIMAGAQVGFLCGDGRCCRKKQTWRRIIRRVLLFTRKTWEVEKHLTQPRR